MKFYELNITSTKEVVKTTFDAEEKARNAFGAFTRQYPAWTGNAFIIVYDNSSVAKYINLTYREKTKND